MPLVLDLAEATAKRAAPGAWIVDFTNPVGIVTQALLDEGHRAVGLCNVAINLQRQFAKRFEVEPDRVQLEHVGLNHLSWERAVRVDGVDRLPELLETEPEVLARARRPARRARPDPAARSRRTTCTTTTTRPPSWPSSGTGTPAPATSWRSSASSWSCTRTRAWPRSRPCSSDRGGAFYSEAAAQLIASLHDGAGDIQVVDVRNDGALPDLPDSAVVEIPCRVDRDGAHPLPLAPLAPEMRGLVQAAKAYEELAVAAAMSGDRRTATARAHRQPARRCRGRRTAARRPAGREPGVPAEVLPGLRVCGRQTAASGSASPC